MQVSKQLLELEMVKVSLGLEKKTMISKALDESSNWRKQNQTLGPTLMLLASCIYLGLITPYLETICQGHITPAQRTYQPLPKTSHPLFNDKCHLK